MLIVNTLVKHKKLKSLGIGCVSKVLSKKVKVNFGEEDVLTCSPDQLTLVDVSKTKTMKFEYLKRKMISESKDEIDYVIIGNELKNWVGFGFVTIRVVTEEDLLKYKRIV